MNVHVVVPVRDEARYTSALLGQLAGDGTWDACWVFDNGSTDDTPNLLRAMAAGDDRFRPIPAPGVPLYRMWDAGFGLAASSGADAVLFLNNDITLAPGTILALADALTDDVWISYPNYDRPLAEGVAELGVRETHGTYRHGGMAGFCFLLAAAHVDWHPLVDPALAWWGGDDDIAFQVQESGGRQVRVEGLPLEHALEGTARHHAHRLAPLKAQDLAHIRAKWGR